MNAREAVAQTVIRFEGGDSDHPADKGGWTRFGLTLANFRRLRPGQTEREFRALTRDDVIDIMCEEWALKPGYARIIDDRVRWLVIDYAIHSGDPIATKALQRAVGARADGIFGPDTQEMVNRSNGVRLFETLAAARLKHFARIWQKDKTQLAFAAGWINRVATILEVA